MGQQQQYWSSASPTIIFKWAPNNNIDPGGPGLLNLMFANQFKWAPCKNIWMGPQQ